MDNLLRCSLRLWFGDSGLIGLLVSLVFCLGWVVGSSCVWVLLL